jgi:hypothetical protein
MILCKTKPNQTINVHIQSGKYLFCDVLQELNELKDDLGGSPYFANSLPTIEDNDSNRKFLGLPISAVKDWLRMTINKQWSPKTFWSAVAKLFNVTKDNSMSQYEEAHIRIQRFGLLIANKDYIKNILDQNDKSRFDEFSSITGLAWHPNQNSPGTEKMYIDFVEHFLTINFEYAKEKGKKALIDYFKAFDGVCFEWRARSLEEHAKNNPLPNSNGETVNYLADWSTKDRIESVYMKEAQSYALINGDAATPTQLLEHLVEKGIFELEFITADGEKSKPSLAGFNEWAEEQVTWCILSEEPEPPKLK